MTAFLRFWKKTSLLRIANEPGTVAMRIEPVDFQTGAIFLSAPVATALEIKKFMLD
jgi:hypothetical protein